MAVEPFPFQYEILADNTRHKIICAGRRVGKTWVSCMCAVVKAINQPKSQILFIGITHSNIEKAVFQQLQDILDPMHIEAINKKDRSIKLINGSKITLYGSENFRALRGWSPSPDMVCCDELAFWENDIFNDVIKPMVADKRSPIIVTSTPWVPEDTFHKLFQLGQDPNEPDYMSWQFSAWDVRPDMHDEITQAKKTSDILTFKREWEASFVNSLDGVFYNFDSEENCGNFMPINREFVEENILVAIDFNVRKMHASVCVERDNKLFVLEEYSGDDNTQQLADRIKNNFIEHWRQRRIIVYPDPAGAASKSNAAIGQTDIEILRQSGFDIQVKTKHPAVVDSVNAVNAMLCNAQGERRMYVDKSCQGVINSLVGTQWKSNLQDPGIKKINKALDNDHWSDGLRYLVDYRYPIRMPVGVRVFTNNLL